MDAAELLAGLPHAGDRIAFLRQEPARPGVRATGDVLSPAVAGRFRDIGVTGLWAHQAEALNAINEGRSVVVATGTASGKSLVYQAALAELLAATPAATALFVFPTKALTQDQLGRLHQLKLEGAVPAVYDGDTPQDERAWIRRRANVVLTNPDMLHAGILGGQERWAGFLRNLALVVVDEAHVYRGVFGSHVACVLRRLRRVVDRRGAAPRFVLASATIGNPAEHAAALTGLDVFAVTEDSSPRGPRVVAGWQPPDDDDEPSVRRSAIAETSDVLAALVERGATTLAFTRSRRAAEVVAARAGETLGAPGRVAAYRAGYLPEERRELERRLLGGELDGVAATTALELGIDVGGLDAVVVAGFPGTRAAFRQQLGRAGRSSREALGIFIVDDDPLDRYLADNPSSLLDDPPEACVADPSNQVVLAEHLACAAFEAPLTRSDERWFGPALIEAARSGLLEGTLATKDGLIRYAGRGLPHRERGLRGAGPRVQIVDAHDGALLGEAGLGQALRSLHSGAIYLHQRRSYEVQSLDLERYVALVEATDAPWYTVARSVGDLDIVSTERRRDCGPATLRFGRVRVVEQVVSYARRRVGSGELLGEHALDLPEQTLDTAGCWWSFEDAVLGAARVSPVELPGALHAAEHTAIALLPLLVSCDKDDVGGISTPLHRDTGMATIVLYDGMEGGAGFADAAERSAEQLLATTRDRLAACPCARGCPSCVQSPRCGSGNEPLEKDAARRLLEAVVGPADPS